MFPIKNFFYRVSEEFDDRGTSQKVAYTFSEELLRILKESYVIDRHHLYLSASIGVNGIGNSSIEARHFIKEADIAMYEAKAQGVTGSSFSMMNWQNVLNTIWR